MANFSFAAVFPTLLDSKVALSSEPYLFRFRESFTEMTREDALKLCEAYSQDISVDLVDELPHFKAFAGWDEGNQ